MGLGELCEKIGFLFPKIGREKAQEAQEVGVGFCHRDHGARTQSRKESNRVKTATIPFHLGSTSVALLCHRSYKSFSPETNCPEPEGGPRNTQNPRTDFYRRKRRERRLLFCAFCASLRPILRSPLSRSPLAAPRRDRPRQENKTRPAVRHATVVLAGGSLDATLWRS